jgi:hypothetical protein
MSPFTPSVFPQAKNDARTEVLPMQPNIPLSHYAVKGERLQWNTSVNGYEAIWETPIIDWRVEWRGTTDVAQAAGTPVYGVGTFGMNRFLNITITGAPASYASLRIYTQEFGNPMTTGAGEIFELTPWVDVTTLISVGGTGANGASQLQCALPPGMRFWKLKVKFVYPTAPTPVLSIYAASN